jgi:curved DNA-binding protein CbpA
MKLESAYFDKIRVASAQSRAAEPVERVCEATGCSAPAAHRAPKGRHAEGQYYWFCLDHVRAYNKAYNYFAGMDDGAVQAFQKASTIGHRPTWRVGVGSRPDDSQPMGGRRKFGWAPGLNDPFELFPGGFEARRPEPEPRRSVRNMERSSLQALGLDATASPAEIKARYKILVKRHHPDANGGDRSCEDRLRQIIQAYSYLKSVGFC